ncbi:hypothetical protein H0H92_012737, partial [Tricholoma furcatifolium]
SVFTARIFTYRKAVNPFYGPSSQIIERGAAKCTSPFADLYALRGAHHFTNSLQ